MTHPPGPLRDSAQTRDQFAGILPGQSMGFRHRLEGHVPAHDVDAADQRWVPTACLGQSLVGLLLQVAEGRIGQRLRRCPCERAGHVRHAVMGHPLFHEDRILVRCGP